MRFPAGYRYFVIILPCLVPLSGLSANEPDGAPIELLTSQTSDGQLRGWKFFSEDTETEPADVWTLTPNDVLVCEGTPRGYLATRREYKNFVLTLEWSWPGGNRGKGGILLRTSPPDKIWPKSLEAQINAPDAGDFWGLDGFRLHGPDERMQVVASSPFGRLTNLKKSTDAEKPAGQWNQYRITARGATVTLEINGQQVNQATGCDVTAGPICLTAEGNPIQFRKIRIVPIEQ